MIVTGVPTTGDAGLTTTDAFDIGTVGGGSVVGGTIVGPRRHRKNLTESGIESTALGATTYAKVTRTWCASTCSPTLHSTSLTTPAVKASIRCSIFMASITTSTSPAATD